jgi:hypothetical protein
MENCLQCVGDAEADWIKKNSVDTVSGGLDIPQ